MAPLRFDWQNFLSEIEAMSDLAQELVDKNTLYLLDDLKRELHGAKAARGAASNLEIPVATPLRTAVTDREYERGKSHAGAYNVLGTLSCKWEISVQGTGRAAEIHLIGNATTRIDLFSVDDEGTEHLLHMWRMEVGAEDGPGCCFHVQVGYDSTPPFPADLPVPRLPTFVVTPMAALEFLLGELFQERWPQLAGRADRSSAQLWRRIQRERWKTLLSWQTSVLTTSGGSPWPALKAYPGSAALF